MELELLQTKLKSQILEHQVLVKQIKSDPQNPDLQKRLKALQNNITSLSEEQNRVVNQLRQELIKPGQQREYDNKNCNTGKLTKVTIKQEPMDHYNDVKPVIMKSVSVSTQNLPNLKPRPSPVVIVSSQSSPTYIYKSPSSPFNVKSPNNISVHQHNNNVLSKDRVSSSAGRSSGNYSSINLPTLLPKPPILIPNELPKKENVMPMDPKKLEFMSALGLITPQAMIEIQAKRQERKRRSNCISPYSSLLMEPEPKKMGRVMMLPVKRGRGRPPKYHSSSAPCSPKTTSPIPNGLQDPSPNKKMRYSRFISEDSPPDEDDDHESACAVCKTSGELLMCDTCNLVYHMNCLDPPLTAIPSGMWICPKCKLSASDCETMPWPGMLSVVRSYMAHKTAKEDEKNYLIKRSQELQAEKMELEAKAKRLSQSIMEQMQTKSELSSSNRKAKNSVDKLIQFIELVQSL